MDWKGAKQIRICGSNAVRSYELDLDSASGDSKKWVDSDYLGGALRR